MLTPSFRLRLALPALVGAALLAAGLRAEELKRDYQPSEAVAEMLSTTHKAAIDAKNYQTAIDLIEAQLAKLPDKTGYDAALLYLSQSQDLLQKGDYSASIRPLELCVQLSDSHTPTYFEDRLINESVYYLAILYYQEAGNIKDNPAQTASYFTKAENYINRWVKNTTKPTVDGLSFYASLLYNRAIADPEHPDGPRLELAMKTVDQALHLAIRPKDNLYVLKLVCLQTLNRNEEAAELLELLVQQKPDNKTFWSQLASMYLNMNQEVRAILAFERAQAAGHMNSPKDNLNLVGIHFNIAQYSRAAELIEQGLKTGGLENDAKNWELLASSYQQLNRDLKAIDALVRATKQFPQNGQLEYLIAQGYYNMEKYPEALRHLQLCVSKGGGKEPHKTYLFLAFIAFDIKKYDLALDAANKALAIPEGAKDAAKMKQAIEDALKEREAKLNKA